MAQDHRVVDEQGDRIPFSCQNRRFCTNLRKGYGHTPHSQTRGSVLEKALIDYGDYSLWLEHVVATDTNEKVYWFMWYNGKGWPTIPLSGVFGKENLEHRAGQLTRFVP